MEYTGDLKFPGFGHAGSNPAVPTNPKKGLAMSKIWVVPEKCFIKPRDRSNKYQAWFKVNGKWRRETTGTSDSDEAKDVALERYMKIFNLEDKGVPLRHTGKLVVTFNDVAMMKRRMWLEDIQKGFGKPVHDTYIKVVNRWFIPFFEGMPLTDVDDDVIEDFERHRRNEFGKELAKSTINNHNCVFRAIFELARRRKYIQSNQIPRFTVKGKGRSANPRPSFTTKEMVAFQKFMAGWRQDHDKSISRYKAKLLFYYAHLLVTSGIRTGKEIGSIQWKHVDENYLNEANGKHYIRLGLPHRKTERSWADDHVLISIDFLGHLNGLKKFTRRTEPDDYLFCAPDGEQVKGLSELFGHCLEDAEMRYQHDDPNKGRSLYSLRHFYATQRISREKVTREVLSKHMATSIIMLEKYYVDVETALEAESLAPSFKSVEDNGALKQIDAMDVPDEVKARLKAAL